MLEDHSSDYPLIENESATDIHSVEQRNPGVTEMTRIENLSGKTALVTGGSRSIGAAIARHLAAAGAAVAITYSASPDKAAAVVREIEDAGGRAIAIRADAGDPAAVRAAVLKTEETFGSLDILVNNAGIALGGPIEDIKFEDYERMIAVNVTGADIVADGGFTA